MADLITELTQRIEDYRATNKRPCRSYATRAAAERATAAAALRAAVCFQRPALPGKTAPAPARYVVFFVEPWGRWVGCLDFTELLRRPGLDGGGFLGVEPGFFKY